MFKELLNFGYKRNFKEALGFYLAYLLLAILVGGLMGGLSGIIALPPSTEEAYNLGTSVGTISSAVLVVLISFLILKEKGQLKNFAYIILILLSGILALFVGGLGGLIPVAYLTTRENLTGVSPDSQ